MSRLCIVTLLFNLYGEYIMQNARLDEAQAGIKITRRNINSLRYADAAAKLLQLCPTLCDPMDSRQPTRLLCPWDSPGKNPGVGCHALLLGFFLTQISNPHLLAALAESFFTTRTTWKLTLHHYNLLNLKWKVYTFWLPSSNSLFLYLLPLRATNLVFYLSVCVCVCVFVFIFWS